MKIREHCDFSSRLEYSDIVLLYLVLSLTLSVCSHLPFSWHTYNLTCIHLYIFYMWYKWKSVYVSVCNNSVNMILWHSLWLLGVVNYRPWGVRCMCSSRSLCKSLPVQFYLPLLFRSTQGSSLLVEGFFLY